MRKILFLYLLSCLSGLSAQTIYPVQVTPQLLPPYSIYLADYVQAGSERFRLIVLQRDLNVAAYQIRLKMRIFRNGSEAIRLRSDFVPLPITVEAGVPVLVSGADLSPYLNEENWEFVGGGINASLYQQTKALPEGNYQFCFTAYDYNRPEVAVSGVGCTFAFLSKSEPPMLNLPFCGSEIYEQNSPQIVFQWYPRHLSSPNSAEETEYKFELFEVRPVGNNLNNVVLSSQPVYTSTTDFTQLVYGLSEPPLLDSMQYVWRVQAIDKTGRDAFRNQGYSQVCSFKYWTGASSSTPPPPPVVVGVPIGLKADALNKQTIKFGWEKVATDTFTVYQLEYRKVGTGNENAWFQKEVGEFAYTARDVEPATRYEARVRGKLGDTWGAYSAPVEVTTPADIPMQCGDDQQFPQADMSKPLGALLPQMTLVVRGMDVVISEVSSSQNGYFTGRGKVIAPYLGANFRVKFEGLYIDERLVVGAGKVEFLSQGMANFITGQLANQEMRQTRRQQQANQMRFAKYEFYGTIFTYQVVIDSVTVNKETGYVTIFFGGGNSLLNNAIIPLMAANADKAFLIQDKNGDQWVIKPDGTVEKAEGGGLPPSAPLSTEARNILKQAFDTLRQEYTSSKVDSLHNVLTQQLTVYKTYLLQQSTTNVANTSTSETSNAYIGKVRINSPSQNNSQSEQYKVKEYAYNVGLTIRLFCLAHTENRHYDATGNFLEVASGNELQLYADYVETEKGKGTSESVIISNVRLAIIALIQQTIQSVYYQDPSKD